MEKQDAQSSKSRRTAALHRQKLEKDHHTFADFDSSAVHFQKVHPVANRIQSSAKKKGKGLSNCSSLSRDASTFVGNMLRLITRSSLPEEVKQFFHSVELYNYGQRIGWSPKRLDFLVFEFVRMLVLTVFIFHFSVRCVVDSTFRVVEPIYGCIILLEVVYKTNTRKLVNGQIINTKLGLLRDYVRESLLLDLALILMIILELVGIDCGVFKLMSLVKLRDLTHIVDRFEHWLSSSKRVSIAFDIFKSVCSNFVLGHLISLALLGMAHGQEYSWITIKQLQSSPWEQKYMWAFYWATTTMLTVGFGDFTATTPFEALILSLIEITSILMLAYTISRIGDLIRQYQREDELKVKKLKTISKYFTSNSTPLDLQDRTKWCISNECDAEVMFDTGQEDKVVQELPNDLRNEIMTETYFRQLRNLPFFVKLTCSTIHKLAKKVERKMFYSSQTLIEKGVVPTSVFMLTQGKLVQSIASRRAYDPVDAIKVDKNEQYTLLAINDTVRETPTRLKLYSEGFSMVCWIKFDELIATLRQKKIDYETFCYARDQIKISKIDSISRKCSHCSSVHDILECAKFHYVPVRSIVCLKYCKERCQQTQKQLRRKLQRKTQQTLVGDTPLHRYSSTDRAAIGYSSSTIGRGRPRMSILKVQHAESNYPLTGSTPVSCIEELNCDKMHEFEVYFRQQNLSKVCRNHLKHG